MDDMQSFITEASGENSAPQQYISIWACVRSWWWQLPVFIISKISAQQTEVTLRNKMNNYKKHVKINK